MRHCGQTLSHDLGIWARCCKPIEFIVSAILDQSSTYSRIVRKETLSNETKIQRKGKKQMHIPKMALENPHLELPVLLPSSKNYLKDGKFSSQRQGRSWFVAVGERPQDHSCSIQQLFLERKKNQGHISWRQDIETYSPLESPNLQRLLWKTYLYSSCITTEAPHQTSSNNVYSNPSRHRNRRRRYITPSPPQLPNLTPANTPPQPSP